MQAFKTDVQVWRSIRLIILETKNSVTEGTVNYLKRREDETYLTCRFVGLDAEEPMPGIRRAENITEGSRVAHVLSDKRYFMHRMMV